MTDQPAGKPTRAPSRAPIRAPKGTRDLYPGDMLRRRYITKAWRDVSIRCGFEEIDGPTFEAADLYAIKSGEGILGELFQAYSGKSPEEVEQVQASGRAPFAMRPEFTPTLARMYAAKANSLPTPCKWFSIGPYFRAERPQRGRLREFLQWNVDVIGDWESDDTHAGDLEALEPLKQFVDAAGLTPAYVREQRPVLCINSKKLVADVLVSYGIEHDQVDEMLPILDAAAKVKPEEFQSRVASIGGNAFAKAVVKLIGSLHGLDQPEQDFRRRIERPTPEFEADPRGFSDSLSSLFRLGDQLHGLGLRGALDQIDFRIVRGLAYYTGTVFELAVSRERALAGGGRYDNLIELMGGPPTPAVGFAMGDVVLELVLQDRGLMPEGKDLLEAVSAPSASLRPEVFCIAGGDPEAEAPVRRLAADLRRGIESKAHQDKDDAKPWDRDRYDAASDGVRPLHARTTYKATRNLKKLLSDAEKQFARFAAIVHEPDKVQLKDLDDRTDLVPADVPSLPRDVANFSVDPGSPVYVGRAVQALTH